MERISLDITDEEETRQLGTDMALVLRPGDMLCLSGELGAGKTFLARSVIRKLASDKELEVPSPTYTVCQTYDTSPPVAHLDLYRLSGPDELNELGWEEMLDQGMIIVEWPEHCFGQMPPGAVLLRIDQSGDSTRTITISGNTDLVSRIDRSLKVRTFLDANKLERCERRHLAGDASARSYELLESSKSPLLLMNSPAAPDSPPLKNGKTYSEIAHLAENVTAFVAIAKLLRDAGFAAPKIPGFDLEQGLLLVENFGSEGITDGSKLPFPDRYMASIEFLSALHQHGFAKSVGVPGGGKYRVPDYDQQAMIAEAELLLQWYVPSRSKNVPDKQQTEEFHTLWSGYSDQVQESEPVLVLRDFHSPNIIWRGEETGSRRVGVIDFQDAVFGPAAYDVASLAQDARVDVSEELEQRLVDHYVSLRNAADAVFCEERFRAEYAIMAAQRATKILGIFVRLDERDGKPGYLKHLPRMQDYLSRSLRHPVLEDYSAWLRGVI